MTPERLELIRWANQEWRAHTANARTLDVADMTDELLTYVDELTRQLEDARRIATASGYFQDHRGEDYDLDSDHRVPEWRADPVGPVAWDRQERQR
jgi:hypothetical protein